MLKALNNHCKVILSNTYGKKLPSCICRILELYGFRNYCFSTIVIGYLQIVI
uniref:Uncharacterized protein n=1 Tax=Arundo donax TaxID=35708 RepID=A0A0A9DPM7_ARUDO